MDAVIRRVASEVSILRTRKIMCMVLLSAVALGIAAIATKEGSAAAEARSSDLLRAKLSQAGRSLVFTVRTAAPVPLARLRRQPGTDRGRYLCLGLRRAGRRGERRICVGGARQTHRRVGLELINAAGKTTGSSTLIGRVKRANPHKLALAIIPGDAGLRPARYRWRVLESRRSCSNAPRGGCRESLPRRGFRTFRLRPVRPVGCTGGRAGAIRNGPRDRNAVALTFDDGPGTYTERFLAVLSDKHARGTFFEIGQEVPGRATIMRRILEDGHEIGNHTTHHGTYPGYGDLLETNALINGATHFQPCLFRPPAGAVNASVVAAAGEAGLKTILWDVDPSDWTNPGSDAIYSRVVGATRPGSIVLMHDGGGNRSGTLAALPRIIDALRARGYRFATVSQLLGHRLIYRPYG